MNRMPAFDDGNMVAALDALSDAELDALPFGVIGFGADGLVRRYSQYETDATGLSKQRVLEHDLFTDIAQCMNNYLVAQKYLDAREAGTVLDESTPFVLTWRMRPTPVKLRLLSSPDSALQYLLLLRQA